MEGTLIFPDLQEQCKLVAPEHHAAFIEEVQYELICCVRAAQRAVQPRVLFNKVREAGSQVILEFEVFDLEKPHSTSMNWHGQNTSQWVYAGAVVYDKESGRVSRHH